LAINIYEVLAPVIEAEKYHLILADPKLINALI
jgi:hypothetical protein